MGRDSKAVNNDIIDTEISKWVNDLNMFYGRYDVVGNRDKVDETGARIPVGSPICLRSEHTRMCLKQIRSCKVPGPDGLRGFKGLCEWINKLT